MTSGSNEKGINVKTPRDIFTQKLKTPWTPYKGAGRSVAWGKPVHLKPIRKKGDKDAGRKGKKKRGRKLKDATLASKKSAVPKIGVRKDSEPQGRTAGGD